MACEITVPVADLDKDIGMGEEVSPDLRVQILRPKGLNGFVPPF